MKICVLGSHPETRDLAPFGDPSWQIWACSPHNAPPFFTLPRFDRWYEVHEVAFDAATRQQNYLDYLKTIEQPLYMRDRRDHPKAIPYPFDEMEDRYGAFFLQTSSIALMMAHAIATIVDSAKGMEPEPSMLGVFGVMQQSAGEYTYQLPGIQYYIQRAHDLGIDVVVPDGTNLFSVRKLNF